MSGKAVFQPVNSSPTVVKKPPPGQATCRNVDVNALAGKVGNNIPTGNSTPPRVVTAPPPSNASPTQDKKKDNKKKDNKKKDEPKPTQATKKLPGAGNVLPAPPKSVNLKPVDASRPAGNKPTTNTTPLPKVELKHVDKSDKPISSSGTGMTIPKVELKPANPDKPNTPSVTSMTIPKVELKPAGNRQLGEVNNKPAVSNSGSGLKGAGVTANLTSTGGEVKVDNKSPVIDSSTPNEENEEKYVEENVENEDKDEPEEAEDQQAEEDSPNDDNSDKEDVVINPEKIVEHTPDVEEHTPDVEEEHTPDVEEEHSPNVEAKEESHRALAISEERRKKLEHARSLLKGNSSKENNSGEFEVEAVEAYKGSKGELSFKKGARIKVLEVKEDEGLYLGLNGKKKGWFPSYHVRKI